MNRTDYSKPREPERKFTVRLPEWLAKEADEQAHRLHMSRNKYIMNAVLVLTGQLQGRAPKRRS